MPSSRLIEQLPPTTGIQDPAVRTYLDALKNAWAVRNGDVGATDNERFITKGEFASMSRKAYTGFVSGAIGALPTNPGGPGTGTDTHESVATGIVNSLLYAMLGASIPEIRPPYEALAEIDSALARAMQGVTLNRNKITRLTEENDARLRDIRALWTSVGQYDSLIFDEVLTEAGRASRIAHMKASYGSIEAAITDINTVTVDSRSANARHLWAITASIGQAVRTFFNRALAGSVAGVPEYKNAADAMRNPKVHDQWFPPNSVMDIPAYKRRAWNGSQWVLEAVPRSSDYSTAGVLNEVDVRVEKDTANATAINHMWAAVTGAMANIQDGAITFASGQAGAFAQKWTTLQTDVYLPDGTARVTKLRQDLLVGTPVDANGNPDWSQVGYLGAGMQGHKERLDAAYTLRMEVGTNIIGGFGLLASTKQGEGTKLAFGIRANSFWIADPGPDQPGGFNADKAPFIVENGKVYLKDAFISNTIQSDDFVTGSKGWQIRKSDGSAEFNNVTVRGTIYANIGRINRLIVTGAKTDSIEVGDSNGNGGAAVTHNLGYVPVVTLWNMSGTAAIPFIADMSTWHFTIACHFSGAPTKVGYSYF